MSQLAETRSLALSEEQLLHFAEHGWMVLEAVLDADECGRYMQAINRLPAVRKPDGVSASGTTAFEWATFHDLTFLSWYRIPGILDLFRQFIGCHIRSHGDGVHITAPHPHRHERGAELLDPDRWTRDGGATGAGTWHRGLRPKWGTFTDDADPGLVNCTFMNSITYLTPVGPEDGGTALLDGSHKLEGDYETLKDRCEVVRVTAPAGSVFIFTETLLHAAVPVVSERTRYAMFYAFGASWLALYGNEHNTPMPRRQAELLADDELRDLLGPPHYNGQHPEVSPLGAARG